MLTIEPSHATSAQDKLQISETAATSPEPSCPNSDRRAVLWMVCVLSAVVLTGFQCLLLHPGDVLVGTHRGGQNDLTEWFIRSFEFPVLERARGSKWSPWNPYLTMGQPYVGNAQSALYYPANWLCFFLDASQSLSWLLVVHHLWGGMGAALLARHWKQSRLSCIVSGFGLGLAPYWIGHTAEGHYAQIATVAWIPWAILAYERFRAFPAGTWIAVSGSLSLSFFAGHVQETYYLAMLLSTVVAIEAICLLSRGELRRGVALGLGWVLIGLLSLGIVAVDMIPIWMSSQHSARLNGVSPELAGVGLTSQHLPQLLWPAPMESVSGAYGAWETNCYFGLALTGLALAGIARQFRQRGVKMMAGLLLLTIVLAFGNQTPLFELCYRVIPGCSYFRVPSRMLFFSSCCVSILAGFGLDALTTGSGRRSSLPCSSASPLKTQWGAVVIALLVAWELSGYAQRALSTLPRNQLREDSPVSEFLARNKGFHRVLSEQCVYGDREAVRDGNCLVTGYEPVPLVRYLAMINTISKEGRPFVDYLGYQPLLLSNFRQPALDIAGVRYIVASRPQPEDSAWRLVDFGTVAAPVRRRGSRGATFPYWIYENCSPFPRAFVQGNVIICDDWNTTLTLTKVSDPRQAVVISKELLPPGTRATFCEATIVEYQAGRVAIDVDCTGNGYLVLTDMYHPGWKARINDLEVPVVPVNGCFRGMPLPAGRHRVVMEYSPPGLLFGLLITMGAIMFAAWQQYRSRFYSQLHSL